MSKRNSIFLLCLAIAIITMAGIPLSQDEPDQPEETLVAGRNVNMVSGIILPEGDPYLQRQNEPSIAVSTRNPQHILAGANDYRTVDMDVFDEEFPGYENTAGDAWLGVFSSYDGGESWTSTLLPGFPQDSSSSPLKNFTTAADPVVRAGSNGIFFYSGIVFNRVKQPGIVNSAVFLSRFIDKNDAESGDTIIYIDTEIIDTDVQGNDENSSMNTSGKGNNKGKDDKGDDDDGSKKFVDKPWIAVDAPNGKGQTVNIGGESVPKYNVYMVYSVFTEATDNLSSEIIFRRSTDCGENWEDPIILSEEHDLNQGATIAVDPRGNGHVYVAWRRFKDPASSNPQNDAILVARSTNGGKKFNKVMEVAEIPPFDQGSSDITFRTNSYPAMAIDDGGRIYLAWSQNVFLGAVSPARIVMSKSNNGMQWMTPEPIDIFTVPPSHQFMPTLAFAAGKLTLAWYDQRNDRSGFEYGWEHDRISDYMSLRHTIDIWAAQANTVDYPNLSWTSTQVSKYLFNIWVDESSGEILVDENGNPAIYQMQFNPPNYPLFKDGTWPFIGDYVDISPSPMFVLGDNGVWRFNTEQSDNPVFHVTWTDNRDVRPPYDGNWMDYSPPSSQQASEYVSGQADPCAGGQRPGMRNQNIYTSRLSWGVEAGTPVNMKSLNLEVPNSFIIFVRNNTLSVKSFRLSITNQPEGGQASFLQFETLDTLDVMTAPYSTLTRPVFVESTNPNASVRINIEEIDHPGGIVLENGAKSSVTLNPDPSGGGVVYNEETHKSKIEPWMYNPDDPENPNIINWTYLNPNIINPNIINPNIINPNIINPNIINPNIINPNIINPNIINPNIINPNIINPNIINTTNPNIINPNIINPNIINPNIINPNIINANPEDPGSVEVKAVTDVGWTITNEGNTTTSYTLKTLSKESLPAGFYAQLLVYKVHYSPAVAGELSEGNLEQCELKEEPHHQLLQNIVNPNIINPNIINADLENPNIINAAIENATFSIAPGEEVNVNLRIFEIEPTSASQMIQEKMKTQSFDFSAFINNVGIGVVAQEVGSEDAAQGIQTPDISASVLIIGTSSLPDGYLDEVYYTELSAYGGTEPYTWSLNSGQLPPGLSVSTTIDQNGKYKGVLSGTPTSTGTWQFIIEVVDSDSPAKMDTQQYSLTIQTSSTTPDPLTITTPPTLWNGTTGNYYGTTLEATGGVWPREWSQESGSLPPGLTLFSNGTISGTIEYESVSYPYEYTFTARVTDDVGDWQERMFSITVSQSTGNFFTISGMVYDSYGQPLDGVVMRGLLGTPVTGETGFPGYYEDSVPEGWDGTVTPFKVGYSFEAVYNLPNPYYEYDQVNTDYEEQDYNATFPSTFDQFTQITSGNVVENSLDSGGAAWGDFDNDGDLDLFVANKNNQINRIYINQGSPDYFPPTISNPNILNPGLFPMHYDLGNSSGASWGDYDNDGYLDLFVVNDAAGSFLYHHNQGNGFTKITDPTDFPMVNDVGYDCSWADYDNDGYLDLFVPKNGINSLYHNDGDGTFTKMTAAEVGTIVSDSENTNSCAWGDYDNDGDADLFVANTANLNNSLYRNDGGSFTKMGSGDVGSIVSDGGRSPGCGWGDYDNDGYLDLFVTNQNIDNFLYHNDGDGTFTKMDDSGVVGTIVSDDGKSKGCTWVDYDNDGDLDLYVTNDSSEEDNFLYRNEGGTPTFFTRITGGVVDEWANENCWADYDNDGDVDLYAVRNGNNLLFRNNGNSNNWINIECVGTKSNKSAFGAKVRVKAVIISSLIDPVPVWQLHEISGQFGGDAQSSLNAEFGLGDAAIIDEIRVEWPSGQVQTFTDVSVNQFMTITEPDTSTASQLAFTVHPTNTVVNETILPTVTVEIQDLGGIPVTDTSYIVTIGIDDNPLGNGQLNGTTTKESVNGVVTFNDLSIDTVGNGYSLKVTSGSLSPAISNTFNIGTIGTLNYFLVEAEGGGVIGSQYAGTPFNIQITAQDAGGNTVTSFTGTVDITSTGTLSDGGGTTSPFTNGVLSPHSVTISDTGTFTITATRTSETETGTSNAFTVTEYIGPATQLVFTQQPGGGVSDTAWGQQPIVEVQDAGGNTITTDDDTQVTLAINSGDGVLAGLTTLTVENGVAEFIDLQIYNMGSGYTLEATSDPSLIPATSSAFNITSPPAITEGEWVTRYNGTGSTSDGARDMVVDSYGNVYVTGLTWSSAGGGTNENYYTAKYNSSGAKLWDAIFDSPSNSYDMAVAIAVDTYGNVFVTGESEGTGTNWDYYTVKYDSAGVEQWARQYDSADHSNDRAKDIAVDTSGNVYVTGTSISSGGSYDYATIKYDSDGNTVWSPAGVVDDYGAARYDGGSSDTANAIAINSNGVYVTGTSDGGSTYSDYATIKYDPSNGNQIKVARYGTNLNEGALAIALDSSGNIYVTGGSYGSGTDRDYATIKYDSDLNTVWSSGGVIDALGAARYNGPPGNGWDEAKAIAVDSSGNVYVTGESLGSGTAEDYATIKYDISGSVVWTARYNGPGNGEDSAKAITLDSSLNIYVTGNSAGGGTGDDYTTIKYSSSGNEEWVRRYDGPGEGVGNNGDYACAIAVGPSGNIYVTGESWGVSTTSSDFATIKYNSTLEEWVARYDDANGTDEATAVAVDSSGNAVVTGNSGDDIYAARYNLSNGTELWSARYNNGAINKANAIAIDSSDIIYVAGQTGNDALILAYDPNQTDPSLKLLWDQTYDEDYNNIAYDIAVFQSGGNVFVYVTGESIGNYFTAKYNGSNGAPIWVKTYDSGGADKARAIALDSSGNAYVTGDGGGKYYTAKYDVSNGDILWEKTYEEGNTDRAIAIVVDSSGNAYVTGDSYGGSATLSNFATVKYRSSDGFEEWAVVYDGDTHSYDIPSAIVVDSSGNVYVTGRSTNLGYYDTTTVKYDNSGSRQWVRRYNGPANTYSMPYAMEIDTSGNIFITAHDYGIGTYNDYATLKYDGSGLLLWTVRYIGPSSLDIPSAIAIDPSGSGYVYVTGISHGGSTNNDYATIKYKNR